MKNENQWNNELEFVEVWIKYWWAMSYRLIEGKVHCLFIYLFTQTEFGWALVEFQPHNYN